VKPVAVALEGRESRLAKGAGATMQHVRTVVFAAWRRLCEVPVLLQDGAMYALAALFAALTALVAVSSDYRAWGQAAGLAYLGGALVCLVVFVVARRSRALTGERRIRLVALTRRVVVVLVLIGAVIVPLASQLVWRAEGTPGQHAQPEVAVVERAADRAANHHDPYLSDPTTVGYSPRTDAKHIDETSFYPYLPGMIPFGMVNALNVPAELQDARVVLVGFTLVVGAIALLWSDASLARRGRALQFLVVLPSGALALVTGGDDLPVLALMLLGLVLAERRKPVLAGLVIGFGATLKFTAWPLLLLMLFAVRDREDRPAPIRYGLSVLLVAAPIVSIGIALDPSSFIYNVVRFPLGLARVKSPAASPLLGQVLVNALPHHKFLVTAGLLAIGAAIVIAAFVRYRPHTPAQVARFTGFAMTVATALAPATRFGYLIYPVNLFVWAYVLDGMHARSLARQSASSTSKTVSDTVLVGSLSPPPSAGVIDAVTGFTTTPISQ
jgi:hypothetical protein